MTKHRCPICERVLTSLEAKPFCSPRCKDVDLGRWFAGRYAIPADTPAEPLVPDEEL